MLGRLKFIVKQYTLVLTGIILGDYERITINLMNIHTHIFLYVTLYVYSNMPAPTVHAL
jgi:hypothetical protein